ncbi:KxYKxGKxW signal peptide domain-containing protein, partial [Pediococcus acidilactici]|uniref:KxYKxGKxW signal peptide domain-containing protein n=1 Tax=Pediococcus acidilactici TaxID=1254 RepID=UPI001F4E40CE
MSKNKLWNVNEKKRYKMYKDGKQWLFAGIGLVAGILGSGSTNTVSAAEQKTITKNLKNEDAVLATKTNAVIPKSEEKQVKVANSNNESESTSASQISTNYAEKDSTSKSLKAFNEDISQTESKSKVPNSNSESNSLGKKDDSINSTESKYQHSTSLSLSTSESQSISNSNTKNEQDVSKEATDTKDDVFHQTILHTDEDGNNLLDPEETDHHDGEQLAITPPEFNDPNYILDLDQSTLYIENAEMSLSQWMEAVKIFGPFHSAQEFIDAINMSSHYGKSEGDIVLHYVYRHQENQIDLVVHDEETYVGDPHLSAADFVDSVTNSDGSSGNIDDVQADFSEVNWDVAGKYTVHLTYFDAKSLGTVERDATLTVLDNNSGSESTSTSTSDKQDSDSRSASTSDKNDSDSRSASTSDKNDSDSRSASTSDKNDSDSRSASTSDKNDSDSRSASTSDKNDDDSRSASTSDKNDDDSRSASTSTSDKNDSDSRSTSTSDKNDDDSRSVSTSTSDKNDSDSRSTSTSDKNDDDSRSASTSTSDKNDSDSRS